MKIQMLGSLALAVLLVGCAMAGRKTGVGAAYNDNDVLTGGPVAGTKVSDLPDGVRQTLKNRYAHEEISDIDRTTRDGQEVYLIKFARSGTPIVTIHHDGKMVQTSDEANPSSMPRPSN